MSALELSESLARVVETHSTSLVRVEARAHRPSTGVVYSADGIILTAHHATERDEGIDVTLHDGSTLEATLVGRDAGTDLAVLRVEAKNLAPVAWRDIAGLKVGHLAVTLARPGKTARAALGIVSALGDEFRTPAGGKLERYVQTDTRPARGFSGGIVADVAGGAIGMNTAGIIRDVNLVVPAATIRRVVGELIAHGRMRRTYLGVGVYPVRLTAALEEQLKQRFGLIVVAVEAASPAEKAGIYQGDVLVSVGGQPTARPADLSALLEEDTDKPRAAKLVRSGAVLEVTVTPGARD